MAASLALLAAPAFADARTFRVNKTGDHAPGACTRADCTLREAVIAANARTGLDTILLRGGRVYGLTRAGAGENFAATGDLDVIDSVAIRAARRPGRPLRRATIDGNDLDRVLHALAANLTLRSVVVRDGTAGLVDEDGGGIFASEGVLTLIRSVVRGNVADSEGGGVDVDGTVPAGGLRLFRGVITGNSTISEGGGGVSVDGTATVIRRSTISGNRAIAGVAGGVRQGGGGTLTITSSTVSRNLAGNTSGGIRFSGSTGVMTLTNVTVEGNRSVNDGGGIRISSGTANLTAVTIIRNAVTGGGDGGGLQEDSNEPVSIKSSIIALNTIGTGTGTDCFSNMGIDSGGHNLRGSDDPACTGFSATGDKVSGAPLLRALRNNGGPTKTACPLRGSPAINAGAPSAPARDQRGRKRVKRPEIGACEFTPRKRRR